MTIAIVLSAHGSMSEELLRTTEMITGKQANIAWINLLSTDNTDTLIQKYNKFLNKLNTKNGVLFLVDMWGGTPFNAAQKIILNQKNSDIITGMNIPMLIEICIARDHVYSIQELINIALQSGLESIKSTKYSLPDYNLNYKSNKPITDNKKITNKTNHHNHMDICLTRIDDRLIHGQVVTRWAKEYNINRIIIVNDEISQDTIRKNLLTQVTPPGITAHVIDIQKTIRVYNNPKYSTDKVIMLFTNPIDVLRMIEIGVPIKSVNIGGMAFCHGKKQINNVISVNTADIEAFKKLNNLGIELEIRKVPSDSSIKLMKLIENIN